MNEVKTRSTFNLNGFSPKLANKCLIVNKRSKDFFFASFRHYPQLFSS